MLTDLAWVHLLQAQHGPIRFKCLTCSSPLHSPGLSEVSVVLTPILQKGRKRLRETKEGPCP